MEEKDRKTLKTYFETGDQPTEQEFAELIDSLINKVDDDITINSSKNIGIGTKNPSEKLDVNGTIQAKIASVPMVKAKDKDGLKLYNEEGEKGIFIEHEGNVGIGTTHPASSLEVNGRIQDKTGDIIPVGAILPYAAATNTPRGWLLCDGRAVSRTEYTDLFEVIGTLYGSGDETTTFNLPDLKGRVPVGLDTKQPEFDTVGETGGEKAHILTIEEMPSHKHTFQAHLEPRVSRGIDYTDRSAPRREGETSAAGGDQPHNNLQPYIALNYIIKY